MFNINKYLFIFLFAVLINCLFDINFLIAKDDKLTNDVNTNYILELKEYAENSCVYYSEFLKINKIKKQNSKVKQNILIFTIYYDYNEVLINEFELKNIDNVLNGLLNCNKDILIIANGSSYEKVNNIKFEEMIFKRGINIYNLFLDKKFDKNKIHMMTCSNLLPLYLEKDEQSIKGNQRVDVIMLGDSVVYHYLDCLNNQ